MDGIPSLGGQSYARVMKNCFGISCDLGLIAGFRILNFSGYERDACS
jgi:hypothetical protein